jgi:HEAT repeat protein
MAIKMLCPTCGAAHDLADSQEGKTVTCKKCEQKFTVKPPRSKKKADDDDDRDSRTERGPRRSRVRDEEEDDRPRRRRARDDDDDDEDEDDRQRRRVAKKSSGGGTVWIVLGSIAAVLILMCGGGGLAFYFAIKDAIEEEQAQIPAGPAPVPGPGFGGGKPIPPPVQPPPPVKPQPGVIVTNLDEAVEAIKQKDRWRQDNGTRWLANAQPDAARRGEVVAILEQLARERKGAGSDAEITALAAWGGKDSLPTLIEVLHDSGGKGGALLSDNVRFQAALRALGNLKDPKAAPALVEEWYVDGGQDTAWALRLIGPGAQKDVLPAIDHPNDTVRESARGVIQSYNTPPDVVSGQVMTDMADKDWGRRGAAASWLVTAAPKDAQRPKVVKALDGMLTDVLALNDPTLARDIGNGKTLRWPAEQAANALVNWAGKDDLAALEHLVKALPNFGFLVPQGARDGLYDALARTGDEKAVALIVRCPRLNARLAADAIKRMGPTGESGLRKALDDSEPEVQRVLPQLFLLVGMKDNFRFIKALSDVKSADKARRIAGADQLKITPVDDARREEVAGLLRPLIDAEDMAVQNVARDALIRWATKDDLPVLIKMLGAEGRTQQQRMALIEALGATKDAKAVEALVPLVGGTESSYVEQALIKAGSEAEKPVRKLVDSTDPKVRLAAGHILKGIGVKDTFEFEGAFADARSDDARRRANGLMMLGYTVPVPDDKKADVLKLAEKLKDDSDMRTRQQAVHVLAKYATKDQGPALMKLLEGKADGQRAEVIAALGRLKEEKAAPLLVKCLGEVTDRTAAEKALTDIGSGSEKAILAELKSNDKSLVRTACIRLLAKVGTKDSLPTLEDIAKDLGARSSKALMIEANKAIDAIKQR